MRKITFGNRSDNGLRNHEVIMSLIETAKLHNADPLRFMRLLLTNPTQAAAIIFPENFLSQGNRAAKMRLFSPAPPAKNQG